MFQKKQGFPEDNELVICTVTKVQFHSVFVNLDEYGKSGMIHISEVSPGRIRNIRDYVKEGKKIVCIVLGVNKERGHIDLSLRRVNDGQRRAKIDEIKKEQLAEKIIEFVAKDLKIDTMKLFNDLSEKILKKYDSLYECFEEVVSNEGLLEKLGLEKKTAKNLENAIKQRVKEAKVSIEGKLKLETYDVDGVSIIKEAFKKAKKVGKDNYNVKYMGGGNYSIQVDAKDFKQAEKILKKTNDVVIDFFEKNKGSAEFIRAQSKKE